MPDVYTPSTVDSAAAQNHPRIIRFEGRTIRVPHDTSDDEIRQILNSSPASDTVASAPHSGNKRQALTLQDIRAKFPQYNDLSDEQLAEGLYRKHYSDMPREQFDAKIGLRQASPPPHADRRIQSAVQGAGRAVADTIGLAPDLANMGANALLSGANLISTKMGGPPIDFRFRMVSDELANSASKAADAVGFLAQDPEKMSENERLAYNVNRFGGQAALTAGALAPVAAARAAAGAKRLPQVGDAFLRAYEKAPAAAAVTDVAAGAGAGAGLTAAQSAPESVRHSLGGATGVALDLAGMATGQVGAATLRELSTRGPSYLKNRVTAGFPARGIPFDPETGMPVSNATADEAARFVQSQTADPQAAANSISRGANDFRVMGVPTPTSGALSNDPKLAALERGQRRLAPAEFAPRDIALRDAALETMEGIQPQHVEPRVATAFFKAVADKRVGDAHLSLRNADDAFSASEASQREIADGFRQFSGRGSEASIGLDRAITERGLAPAQREKNRLFDAVDPDRNVMRSVDPLVSLADDIEKQVAEIPQALQAEMVPQRLIADIKKMKGEIEIDTETGQEIVKGGRMSFGAMNDMRAGLASSSAAARRAGQYRLAENLDRFRSLIGRESDALASEGGAAGARARAANEFYREQFAPVWNRGPGDEAARFRKDFNTDQFARTTTPPTATAGRFITIGAGAKEKAESLSRVISSLPDAQDQQTATAAVRQYVLSDLSRTIGNDGRINPQQFARWLNGPSGWSDALASFPSVRAEVQKAFSDVRAGHTQRNALAREVERASANVKRTETEVANSALSLVIGREPIKAARAVLESRDPQMAMRDIRRTIGGNKSVLPAWERAVTDHLVDRITRIDPAAVSTGDRAIDYAKLVKTFDRYKGALSELYAGQPDKMNALQRVQKILEPLAKQSGPATTAMPGAEGAPNLWKAMEVGLKAHYGILKGGGVLRTLKIMTSFGGDEAADVQRLVTRMMFDPELAGHLLTRKVEDVGSPAWNAKLGKLLRRVEVGREVFSEDSE